MGAAVTTIEEAARNLAGAELQRARAEGILRSTVETYNQAAEAHKIAVALVDEATAELMAVVHPAPAEKLVKRPAVTADSLLDLDDNGGH
ncbi:hypothetical protein [Pseudarthrobacter sp. S9]|uniref:hypothetical protein n=1 Tax=Pseudarthrobacter sp. S9 TaxID=3418421 RepID=UPI003CFBDB8C